MFFTGSTIPLTDVMHQNHQSVAMTQNRTPPTLFQYPSKCSFIHFYYSIALDVVVVYELYRKASFACMYALIVKESHLIQSQKHQTHQKAIFLHWSHNQTKNLQFKSNLCI